VNPIHPALAPLARAAKEMPYEDCSEALREALKTPAWLRPEHRVGDPTGYMRHVLYVDPESAFVITAITWLPGQMSPVHGHQVSNRTRGTIVSLHLYGVSAERLTTGINRVYSS
jgi:predicted metal-dependent enzyme (double-stranded beta helix superfamily)